MSMSCETRARAKPRLPEFVLAMLVTAAAAQTATSRPSSPEQPRMKPRITRKATAQKAKASTQPICLINANMVATVLRLGEQLPYLTGSDLTHFS